MEKPVLAIAHVDPWAENRIIDSLRERGMRVETRYIESGDTVPVAAGPYAAVIIGGGLTPIAEACRLPHMRREFELVRDAVSRSVPLLGVCLGAQVLAAAFGEIARPEPAGRAEFGYHPIRALHPCLRRLRYVFQWHWEGVELPAGAMLLATGALFPTQAFRMGDHAYGLQFHPCIGPAQIEGWIRSLPDDRLPADREAFIEEQKALAEEHDPHVMHWLEAFLPQWLAAPAAS